MTNKIILGLIGLILSGNIYGQKLTLTSLISLCNKKNWESVNQNLLAKGWTYYDSEKGDTYKYNTITWSYNKEYYSEKAQGWFYLYTYEGYPNKISYTVFNKQSYSLIQNSLSSNGFKLANSEIEDNAVISSYKSKNYSLEITTSRRDDDEWSDRSVTAYKIVLIKRAGIYDPDNGKKTENYYDGSLKAEYTLKGGKLNGLLTMYYSNGQLQKKGTYVNGKQHGKFIEYSEDGEKEAEYTMLNDNVHGVLWIFADNKISIKKEYNNGVLSGRYIEYHYDDDDSLYLKIQGQYNNELKMGLWETVLIENGEEDIIEFQNYLNDEKHGNCKEYISHDTLEISTYNLGKLDGPYKRQIKQVFTIEGSETELSMWNLDCEGQYSNGSKDGKWIHYLLNLKQSEGSYKRDKKEGKWIKYVTIGDDSGEIMSETQYVGGLKDGLCKSFYSADLIEDTIDKGVSHILVFTPIDETIFYKYDIRNGRYILKDSTGQLIVKGNYLNDLKDGKWLIRYTDKDINSEAYFIYQEGSFLKDKREGKWIQYYTEGQIALTFNYKNGKLHGDYIEWNHLNNSMVKKKFSFGELIELISYDSLGGAPENIYEIYNITDKSFKCRQTEFFPYGCSSQEYWLKKDGKIDHNWFELQFLLKTDPSSNGKDGYKDGKYELFDSRDKPIITGMYLKENKIGKWTFYFYDQNAKIESDFYNNKGINEKYIKLNGDLFSGEFIFVEPHRNIKEIRKIKNGLRNGKTTYIDTKTNKKIKKENYKDGILK